MGANRKTIARLIGQIDKIIDAARNAEREHADFLKRVDPSYRNGARNLIHYRILRSFDLRSIQKALGSIGISRLAHIESHVLPSLSHTRSLLRALSKRDRVKFKNTDFSIQDGYKMLNRNALAILGHRTKGRRARIMVTLPTEASTSPDVVSGLMAAGMNVARINCAHDSSELWLQMIHNVHSSSHRYRRACRVAMDLAGPKIRTGRMKPGPSVVKIKPSRDDRGHVVVPARFWIGFPTPDTKQEPFLPLSECRLEEISTGTGLFFRDTRQRMRRIRIIESHERCFLAEMRKTAYFEPGTEFFTDRTLTERAAVLGDLPPKRMAIDLANGDVLVLTSADIPGEPARLASEGIPAREATISCTSPEVFESVEPGHRVLFDDGKLAGVIIGKEEKSLRIRITHTMPGGGKLREDKGINFPDSNLQIGIFTEKDREDLGFVLEHADIVNLSFVNRPQDVEEVFSELRNRGKLGKIGVVLKIETRQGYNNLIPILLTAMQSPPVAVMIARGDLAVECGWLRMALIQEEILSICQAAHLPDIWATQVLDELARNGLPTRAEISDAVMGQRAECVMLNKGPQICQAVKLLDEILRDAHQHQIKNTHFLPVLEPVGSNGENHRLSKRKRSVKPKRGNA